MNQYTQLLYYIKSLSDNGGYINTITKGVAPDDFKGSIYPLLNVVIDSGSFTNGATLVFNIVLECVDLRDTNKEIVNDKFWDNDNEVDNHNSTLAELNRIWIKMLNDFEDNNITSSLNPTLTKVTDEGKHSVDGWSLAFDVELPNTTISLCNEC